jgi:hypothetical protein
MTVSRLLLKVESWNRTDEVTMSGEVEVREEE